MAFLLRGPVLLVWSLALRTLTPLFQPTAINSRLPRDFHVRVRVSVYLELDSLVESHSS
jgi:hypothetical protein